MSDKLLMMQAQLQEMSETLEEMSQEWDEVLVTSHNLEMENHYLRERLNASHQQLRSPVNDEPVEEIAQTSDLGLSKARQNLMNIYDDGFHICNISYGQRRDNDEPCMFCLDILYGKQTKDA